MSPSSPFAATTFLTTLIGNTHSSSGSLIDRLTVNLLMQHGGNQGGRPHGHMLENPALTHVRVSQRTKHLLYHMKPKSETVDSFVYRLLTANGGNLDLAGYKPDNTGLFFKRHRYTSDQQISNVAAALDKKINENAPRHSKSRTEIHRRNSWQHKRF